jgi:DNA-binding GntR family transcriptional regulator
MTVSRDSRFPLYSQIRQEIEQDILDKKLVPGDRLPSEDELAAKFGVSRMTARRAIDQLVSRDRLRRIQGQGTFVAEQPSQPQSGGITRWSFERIDQGHDMTQKILQVEELSPSLRVTNALRTIPSETVARITGLLCLDNEPLGYYIDHIPKLLVPTIDDWELGNDTLPNFLARQCGLEFGKVAERVRAVPADEDAIELLGVEAGSPLLYVDSLIFLKSGIPVILSDTAYRCDRYVYRGLLHPLLEDQHR